jgi:biopolymer transport protein ExbD
MRRRPAETTNLITRVNVTPIIDVALVLVIILLVTAPLITVSGLPVHLPEARTREAESERNVSVTLTASGQVAVDGQTVAPATLLPALRARLAEPGNAHVRVVVRADADVPYASVRRLLDTLRDAGAEKIAIATRQKVDAT